MKLLTDAKSNFKLSKSVNDVNYLVFGLHLAPFNLSGFQTCPFASKGCAKACLNKSGRGCFSNVQTARVKKTQLLFNNPKQFFQLLFDDLIKARQKAESQGKKLAIRLNTTSDLTFETIDCINPDVKTFFDKKVKDWCLFNVFPDVQFYDYTKESEKLERCKQAKLTNYYLTFSLSESNESKAKLLLSQGYNVTIVFRKALPSNFWGYNVIDGDKNDLRFLDDKNVIVGLLAKGKAKKDLTGFVKDWLIDCQQIAA